MSAGDERREALGKDPEFVGKLADVRDCYQAIDAAYEQGVKDGRSQAFAEVQETIAATRATTISSDSFTEASMNAVCRELAERVRALGEPR